MTPIPVLVAAVLSAAPEPFAAPEASSALAADAAAPVRPPLTIDAALAQARAQTLELRIAAERLAQARALSGKAWSTYLPQLSVGGSYAWNSDEVVLDMPTSFAIRQLVDASGHPISYPNLPAQDPTRPISPSNPPGLPTSYVLYPLSSDVLELQRKEQYGVQAEVQQALFAPQAIRAIQSAHRAQELAQERVAATTQDVLFGVAQLYYGAASLQQVVAVQSRTLEAWRRHEADAEQLVAQGAAPRLALLKARTDRARAEQDLIRSTNAYDSARQALATLLDRAPDFDVVHPPEAAVPGGDLEGEAAGRPDVRAALAGHQLAESRQREVTARYLPTIGVTGQWRWASITGFTGKHDGWSVMLGARWTIFDGGRREAERTEAGHKVAEAETTLDLARNRARDEVRRAQLDLSSARAAHRKAEEQSRLAGEALRHAQAAYAQGAATYLEVADATTAAQNAELALVTEELSANVAALRLAKAAGRFER